jgi:hypothetical protein
VIYTNRTGRHWMDVQAMRDRNVLLRIEDYAGRVTDNYRGIPGRSPTSSLSTEATRRLTGARPPRRFEEGTPPCALMHSLSFVPIGGNLSLVAGAGVAIPSPNVIDLLGAGVGTAPPSIIGNAHCSAPTRASAAVPSGDQRDHRHRARHRAAATLNTRCRPRPTRAPPATISRHLEDARRDRTAHRRAARRQHGVSRFPFLPVFPATVAPALPAPAVLAGNNAAGSFTAGTVRLALVTMVRDDQANKQAAKNFSVS